MSDDGLAQDGIDIETFGVHTVTFPSDQGGEQCLAISVIDDQIAEGHEDLVFNLVNISGGTDAIAGDSEFGSVLYTSIFDNDNTTVEFSPLSDIEFEENLGVLNACLSINRPSATEATIAMVETSCDGCGPEYATYGVDYEEPSQLGSLVEITFPAGSTEDQCFALMSIDDTSNEGSELLNLFIVDATGGDAVTRVDPLSIIATLLDDESDPTSVFFTYNSGSIIYEDESIGLTEIDVCIGIMEPDPTNATSVDITISPDGEAIDGIDVEIFAPGTITFLAGSEEEECFTVEVIDDAEAEGNEDLVLELTNVSSSNSAIIGDSELGGKHYINIGDDDNTTVGFSQINETAFSENGGVLTVCMSIENTSSTESTEVEIQTDGCQDCGCLLYTSPSPRDKRQSRMPSSA